MKRMNTPPQAPEDVINEMFHEPGPLMLSDREINKQTGIWKRAQEQVGIPLAPEKKAKISLAMTGRRLSSETKVKISEALKSRHSQRGIK